MVGAFPLVSGSNDVAFFGVMSPGVYTAQASDSKVTAAGGSALTEVYILPYSGWDAAAGPGRPFWGMGSSR